MVNLIEDDLIAMWTQSIRNMGFFYMLDQAVGERVHTMNEQGWPFHRLDGLKYVRQSTVSDERVRRIVSSLLERPGLGSWKVLGRDPDHAYCSFRNPSLHIKDPIAVTVQHWPPNSKVVFYERSHLHSLSVKHDETGWYKVLKEDIVKRELRSVEVTMVQGGLSIIDARLAFTVVAGTAVMFGFGAWHEVGQWAKIRLPRFKELEDQAKAMKDEASATGEIDIECFVFG